MATVVGVGTNTGTGVLGYAPVFCNDPKVEFALWGIFTENPGIAPGFGDATHAYVLEWHTGSEVHPWFAKTGAPIMPANFTWTYNSLGDLAPGVAAELSSASTIELTTEQADGGTITARNVVAATIDAPITSFMFWTESHNGTLGVQVSVEIDGRVNPTVYAAGTGQCNYPADSPAAVVLGRTDCLPNPTVPTEQLLAVNISYFDLGLFDLHFYPDEFAV